jgi:hypothetical protein
MTKLDKPIDGYIEGDIKYFAKENKNAAGYDLPASAATMLFTNGAWYEATEAEIMEYSKELLKRFEGKKL